MYFFMLTSVPKAVFNILRFYRIMNKFAVVAAVVQVLQTKDY